MPDASGFIIEGNVVDLHAGRIFPARVEVTAGRIERIEPLDRSCATFLIPGLVDAHIHIESSMLTPTEFARVAVRHGTIATVSDPHEIANVLGLEGIEYMLAEAARSPLKFCFGAPSCVPATTFETAGAALSSEDVAALLARDDIGYLSEVMNFPGVLGSDPELLAMIAAARREGKPVDGHAPGLRGESARRYAAAGISTDHECVALEEALEKIECGLKILIREGSAARNYQALEPLLFSHPDHCMFCSDDLHPDALEVGHINLTVRRAVAAGVDPILALRVASLHPAEHYHLPIGLLREGDAADFVEVRDLAEFEVLGTWIDGVRVAEGGRSLIPWVSSGTPNRFAARAIDPAALAVAAPADGGRVQVIVVRSGQLMTGRTIETLPATDGKLAPDPDRDLLKIAVVNRYAEAPPAVGFIRNFGLRRGAIASSVAHDSHNVVAVGATDEELSRAINLIIREGGGVCAIDGASERLLPLPVAGLMSNVEAEMVAAGYAAVEELARDLGSPLGAPLMALSFMALLVIPELKMSDRGLFDAGKFSFTDLMVG